MEEVREEIRDVLARMKSLMKAYGEAGTVLPPVSKKPPDLFEKESPRHFDPSEGRRGVSSLEALESRVENCRLCGLSRGRTNIVFGEGSPHARLVFIGEGPGREEDLAGKPFVGDAGKLLTDIIEKGMRLTRKEVYICNIVKCRPPGNREPDAEEIRACLPFLEEQIRIIRPEVICTLGSVSGRVLIKPDLRVTRERGTWFSYRDIPVMPTYHPAFIKRNPFRERQLKREVWEDVKKIMECLGLEVSSSG